MDVPCLFYHVFEYLSDISEHMALHSLLGTSFEPSTVRYYEGNFPELYSNLLYLKCGKKCFEIPYLPNLIEMDCEYTSIQRIPYLPNLRTLRINHAPITRLPVLPELRTLQCNRNKIIINLHMYPKLTLLNGIKIRRKKNSAV